MIDSKPEKLLKKELNREELNHRKDYIANKIEHLKKKINGSFDYSKVEKLVSVLGTIQDLERKESEVISRCIVEHSILQAEENELEEMMQDSTAEECLYDFVEKSLHDSNERLNSMKMELASKLRSYLSLKRQIDDVPVPAELIQYELCFSELYMTIQRKLRQTQKCYETYNALLEIKELMVKETSLLNSISTQFRDAITTPAGRSKLIYSMEGILQGIQQKLEKIQVSKESEEKACEAVKGQYRKLLSEQRHGYSLLKSFQEECTRNEKLRGQQ